MPAPSAPIILGPNAARMKCPQCHADILTKVKSQPTLKTHLIALVILIFVCPLAWIPYCKDTCQSRNHFCPNCNAYIGTFQNS